MVKNLIILLFAFTLIASAQWHLDFDEQFASASTGTPDVLDGLVAWWKMDEASWNGTAGEVVDSAGSENATSAGGATTTNGLINRCALLDGSLNRIQSQTVSACDFTNNFSLLLWVKTTDTKTQRILCKRYSAVQYDFFMELGYLAFLGNGGVAYSGYVGATIYDGNWHQIGVTLKDGVLFFVLDGVKTEYTGSTIYVTHQEELLGIGSFPYAPISSFNGLIDDVRGYNRVLSSTEVNQIYNKFKP